MEVQFGFRGRRTEDLGITPVLAGSDDSPTIAVAGYPAVRQLLEAGVCTIDEVVTVAGTSDESSFDLAKLYRGCAAGAIVCAAGPRRARATERRVS